MSIKADSLNVAKKHVVAAAKVMVCTLSCLPVFIATNALALDFDNSRYPYRIPDWLWQDQRRTSIISVEKRKEIDNDIKKLKELQEAKETAAASEKEAEIIEKLSRSFTLRDLTADSFVVTDENTGTKLAVQIDPSFDESAKQTLKAAVPLYLRYALNDEVIHRAFEDSIDTPSPMPDIYQMKDGQPVVDEFGHTTYTKDYKFYLNTRPRPTDPLSFKQQLKEALSTPTGDPALLVISRYTGNVWWGGAYYDFFHNPTQQLPRLAPARGFLYIRLNSDKMKTGVSHWNDPKFWASKFAHEMLHNIGYWHPNYTDPAHRDANNAGNKKAFIVAYEMAMYSKLLNP
jgi:hypothetical protein